MSRNTIQKRSVELESDHGGGYYAAVHLDKLELVGPDGQYKDHKGRTKIGGYAFVAVDREAIADRIRGEMPEADGKPVVYVGDSLAKHYWKSKDHTDIPVDVFEALEEKELQLIANVDGGWANWDGRPEWGETYIDFEDAEVVNQAAIIDERRED
jgi:hypothetical protein